MGAGVLHLSIITCPAPTEFAPTLAAIQALLTHKEKSGTVSAYILPTTAKTGKVATIGSHQPEAWQIISCMVEEQQV